MNYARLTPRCAWSSACDEPPHLSRQRLTAEVTVFDRPAYFRDVMTRGAFRSFAHDHRFDPQGGLIVHGKFAVASGPDWGWRIELRVNDDRLNIDMACLEPSGKADGGVWAEFVRA